MTTPSIGLVVPNYNGARFLRACLDSVLAQGYPNLHCFVADGGSRDSSVAILRSYGDAIAWVSERDGGQAAAIRAGFARVQTDLVGWLNSDDALAPGALADIAAVATARPDAVLIHGDVERIAADGQVIGTSVSSELTWETMRAGRGRTVQPGSFYRRWAVEAAGGVDPSFHLLMDVDLWIRLLRLGPAVRIPRRLAQFRVHEDAKSSQAPWRYYRETFRLALLHERDHLPLAIARRLARVTIHYPRYLLDKRANARPAGS